jgi:antirestriction protein ArdC
MQRIVAVSRALRAVLPYLRQQQPGLTRKWITEEAGPKIIDLMAVPQAELNRVKDIQFRTGSDVSYYLPSQASIILKPESSRRVLSHEFTHARQHSPEETEKLLMELFQRHYKGVRGITESSDLYKYTPLEIQAMMMARNWPVSHPEWGESFQPTAWKALEQAGKNVRASASARKEALIRLFEEHFRSLGW